MERSTPEPHSLPNFKFFASREDIIFNLNVIWIAVNQDMISPMYPEYLLHDEMRNVLIKFVCFPIGDFNL